MKNLSVAMILALLVLFSPGAASCEEDDLPVMRAGGGNISGVMDYDACVRLALHQSPYFITSGMQIELQRIDESDAFYDLFPDITVTSSYVVADPNDDGQPFSIGFSSGNYNPFAAYFSIQAQEILTRMAVLGHLNAISDGIYDLGMAFLELYMLKRSGAFQDEIVALALHKGEYITNRIQNGDATPLEARISEQEVQLAQLERDQITLKESAVLDKIKTILGVPAVQNLELDLQDADLQVMADFDPYAVELEDVRDASIALKVVNYKQELQEYNVQLAYARFIPTLRLGLTTTDAVNSDDTGWYVTAGASTPLWDWGERSRDVTRQKDRMANLLAEEDLSELTIESAWRQGISDLKSAATSLNLARARAELAGLKRRQAEISYNACTITFPDYLLEIENYFKAQKAVLQSELAYSESIFSLRHTSGHLYRSYVDVDLMYDQ